jgi:hypothetical protein
MGGFLWSVRGMILTGESEVLGVKPVPVPQTNKKFCQPSRRETSSGWQYWEEQSVTKSSKQKQCAVQVQHYWVCHQLLRNSERQLLCACWLCIDSIARRRCRRGCLRISAVFQLHRTSHDVPYFRQVIIIFIMYLSWSWATCWPVPVSRIQKPLQRSAIIPSASWGIVFHYPG